MAPVTSKHLQSISELTLVATIRPGFIEALDTCTYTSRLKAVMKALTTLRLSSREYSSIKPFTDTVERIQAIHSFRLAVIEGEQKLLLAVTFDRGWEAYIRIIWRDLGTLLDLVFCNCVDYPLASTRSFADYVTWIRAHQVEANFFYAATPLTVGDLQYLRQVESVQREQRDPVAADRAAVALVIESSESLAAQTASGSPPEAARQGLAALAGLYRLRELYANDDDGACLLRATHEILSELRRLDTRALFRPGSLERLRFSAALDWFEALPPMRPLPTGDHLVFDPHRVQGGILTGYQGVTHGCLVLVRFTDGAAARRFIGQLKVTDEAEGASWQAGAVAINLALTHQGLMKFGVAAADLDWLPQEFREGMEERAGLLGDVRSNHPRHWRLPMPNWPDARVAEAGVPLSTVDAMVQLRVALPWPAEGAERQDAGAAYEIAGNPAHPLHAAIEQLAAQPGVVLLSVQAMLRQLDAAGQDVRGHFGFVDGRSQPTLVPDARRQHWRDDVPRGEILLGYSSNFDDAPPPHWLRDDGSFLVVRKYRQDVPAWDGFLARQVRELNARHPQAPVQRDDLIGKIVGRQADGSPLAGPVGADDNDFNYAHDAAGARCPFQSHVRRSNPRNPEPGKPVPRILRRGMPYGPIGPDAPASAERGVVFMAYNASIAEQFEVVQRWVSGGNSSGVYSGQSDPLLGVPQLGDPRTFRFQHGGEVMRMDLDDGSAKPMVQLEWGLYLFVPSLPALKRLAAEPASTVGGAEAMGHDPAAVKRGEGVIQCLLAQARAGVDDATLTGRWQTCLEDRDRHLSGETAAVWAAIRHLHAGVLDTRSPYGILVGSTALVSRVMSHESHYSVCGYAPRMKASIGPIYLGMDSGDADYIAQKSQITAINAAIQSVSQAQAFEVTHQMAAGFLQRLLRGNAGEATFDVKEYTDTVLQLLCTYWFDLPANALLRGGGWAPEAAPARCPGHFTSPSRYIFSPNPASSTAGYGERHGAALKQAVTQAMRELRVQGAAPKAGSLSAAVFHACGSVKPAAHPAGQAPAGVWPVDELRASTLVGVMMGFLPTVDGNLRSTLYDWLQTRKLWPLQAELRAQTRIAPFERAVAVLEAPLREAMQRSPVPDLVWRTAIAPDQLAGVAIPKGARVVLGLVSATQENLSAPSNAKPHAFSGVFPVFGGDKQAAHAPTHACPGRQMAMGVLLGMLAALMEAGTVCPHPAPLTITLRSEA